MKRFGCVMPPTSVYVVPEIERFGYVITPARVSVIPVEGEN